jgi:hypothetical protein
VAIALLAVLLLAGDALAYAGPVPGPEFFGYFLSLLSLLGVIVSSVLIWPIRAFLARWRQVPPPEAAPPEALPQVHLLRDEPAHRESL